MKTIHSGILIVCTGLSLVGCVNPNGTPDNTATGALTGGVIGAALGAAVGRHPGVGAAIGGAAGVIAGGLIGHSMDQAQQARLQASAPQTLVRVEHNQPLTVEDVRALVAAHISDELIIAQINSTHTVYHLSAADIILLKQSGVTDRVVEFMETTPARVATETAPTPIVTTSEPPPPVVEHVVLAPSPEYVWVPGAWVWYANGWVWCAGHWDIPPHPHACWVGGCWVIGPHGREWHHGYWR